MRDPGPGYVEGEAPGVQGPPQAERLHGRTQPLPCAEEGETEETGTCSAEGPAAAPFLRIADGAQGGACRDDR
jgi:hypothetical protein